MGKGHISQYLAFVIGKIAAEARVSEVVPVLVVPPTKESTMHLADLCIEEAAATAAGNWKQFNCFWWSRSNELHDADNWAILYTHHRDSGLLDQSNSEVMKREMSSFAEGDDPDVVFESHDHWVVGHIDGFSLRVFKNSQITEAFQKYHALMEQLADYPLLDESDYSNREYEATLQNIEEAAWRLKKECNLPEDWASEVYSWLFDHESSEVDNRDDQGGYPSEESLKRAMVGLRFVEIEVGE